eukprot:XP_011673025.1 PREDICTED: deleted in malignant brain tumors 1 protein-like [Strongylocentrotus purpuratus]
MVMTAFRSMRSTSDNRLCCLLDQRENVTCARTSPTSPLETCDRLYPSVVLRIAGWVIGLTSLIGNLTVLVLRLRQEQQLTVQTLLIMNLAVADCLMVRLTGAHFPGGGRVEVFYLGHWRPVCSDHWDLSDGNVACRELGLGTALDVDHGFISSEEMGDYILNDVRCIGSESRILDCSGSTFSIGKCNSTRSARVRCSLGAAETNVRLVDLNDNDLVSEGFVLVYIKGTWGTICAVAWGRVDSEVTCFELGFSGAVLTYDGSYKPHPDNILYDVRCVGNETTILDCPSSNVDEGGDCWAPAKAYVFCTNYTIRLTGAYFPGGGRVEVFYLGHWRPVCSDHWDLSDGHVACRELGLSTALDVDHGFISSEEMGDYILNDVRCIGSESRILDCSGSTFSIGKCNSTRSARVRCSLGVRLVGGRNSSEGRVEFFSKSTWGTVCAESWTLNDAHVVCKSLGFAGALKAFTEVDFGWDANIYLADGTSFLDGVVMYYYNGQHRSVCRDSWDMADAHVVCRSLELGYAVMIPNSDVSDGGGNEVTLDCVYCSGNESSFFDCPGVGIASEGNCNDSRDARVMCSGGTCVQYEVEDHMPTLSALKCLSLGNNTIEHIPEGAFDGVQNLEYL